MFFIEQDFTHHGRTRLGLAVPYFHWPHAIAVAVAVACAKEEGEA